MKLEEKLLADAEKFEEHSQIKRLILIEINNSNG
jgi:hypothetical protein